MCILPAVINVIIYRMQEQLYRQLSKGM